MSSGGNIISNSSRRYLFSVQPSKNIKTAADYSLTSLCILSVELESCSIALWKLSEMAEDICSEPHDLLRGHSGGVTCLAFSPDGGRLLSGGKDQVQCFWICLLPGFQIHHSSLQINFLFVGSKPSPPLTVNH